MAFYRKVLLPIWIPADDTDFTFEQRAQAAREYVIEYIGHGSSGDPVVSQIEAPIVTDEGRRTCWVCDAPAEARPSRGGPIYGGPPAPDPQCDLCDAHWSEELVKRGVREPRTTHAQPARGTCEHGWPRDVDEDCPKCAAELREMRGW